MSAVFKAPCEEAFARTAPAGAPCAARAAPWVLAATILGSSMAFIDGTVVNVALPALQAHLNATLVDVQWVIEAYTLLLSAFLLTGGTLGDRYGRRRVFLIGTALFALASLGCALAPEMRTLIAFRALQGVGGALLVPGSLAILAASFSGSDRGRAIGTWSGASSVSAALGPILGGFLIDHLSWRWAFLVNVPLAAAVVAISLWRVPESRVATRASRLDWPGALLAAAGLGGVVYALLESANAGWRQPRIVAAMALGAIALAAFFGVERRAQSPMLELQLFRSRTFTGANLLTLFLYAALGALLVYLPLDLIQVQGYSSASAGAALLPFVLLIFLLSRWAGGLYDRLGPRRPLVTGCAITAAGFALFAVPGVGGSYWTTFLLPTLVLGFGMATAVAPLTTTVMSSVSGSHAGAASGINNAVARVAGLLAVAISSVLMLATFERHLDRTLAALTLPDAVRAEIHGDAARLAAIEPPASLDAEDRVKVRQGIDEGFVAGFRRVAVAAAALSLLAALTAVSLIGGRDDRRSLEESDGSPG
jgi:EmrB/QacA subfamily drug resistance transporter